MALRVDCYSGHKADERPLRFWLDEREYVIERVVEQWYEPDAACYKVLAGDGNLYVLRRRTSPGNEEWTLLPSPRRPPK